MSCRDTKGWQALAFFVSEMGPIHRMPGGKLSISKYHQGGACRGREKQKGKVCFRRKVYTVNTAKVAACVERVT